MKAQSFHCHFNIFTVIPGLVPGTYELRDDPEATAMP
jgi:hypothetical protein